MKRGDKINCPACRHQTVVREKVEMDGWTPGDKIFVCAFCDAKLGDAADMESKEQRDQKAVSGLAALFETEVAEAPVISEEAGDLYFCKYCKYYVSHAFEERCQLHKRKTAAMHSCPDFEAEKTGRKEVKNDEGQKPVF